MVSALNDLLARDRPIAEDHIDLVAKEIATQLLGAANAGGHTSGQMYQVLEDHCALMDTKAEVLKKAGWELKDLVFHEHENTIPAIPKTHMS